MKYHRKRKFKVRINYKMIATALVAIILVVITVYSITDEMKHKHRINSSVAEPEYYLGEKIDIAKDGLGGFFDDLVNFRYNSRKVEMLENENSELKQKISELEAVKAKKDSLEDLKKSLNFIDPKDDEKPVGAEVIGKNDGNFYESFILSAGAKDGVKVDSIVVNGKGVVGIVYEVTNNYSKAISIINTKASISFRMDKSIDAKGVITHNAVGTSRMNSTDKGVLEGYMFNSESNVVRGDIVSTSGMGLYPGGLPIGEIDVVKYDKNKSIKYVTIRPFVDFRKIDDCMIIPPRNIEQEEVNEKVNP